MQRFIANTVPNLDPNDVTVIITRTDLAGAPPSAIGTSGTPFPSSSSASEAGGPAVVDAGMVDLAGLKLDADSVGRFKFYIIGLLVLLMGVSSFLLINIMRLNRLRLKVQRGGRPERALGGGGTPPLLGEAQAGQGTIEGTFDVGTGAGQRRR